MVKLGTWLGVSKNGQFGVLTHVRQKFQEPQLPNARCRGGLVLMLLTFSLFVV